MDGQINRLKELEVIVSRWQATTETKQEADRLYFVKSTLETIVGEANVERCEVCLGIKERRVGTKNTEGFICGECSLKKI